MVQASVVLPAGVNLGTTQPLDVNAARTVSFITYQVPDGTLGTPECSAVTHRLVASSSAVEVMRSGCTAGTQDLRVQVVAVEFARGVSVVRGRVTFTNSAQMEVNNAAAAPLSSFTMVSVATFGTYFSSNDFVLAHLGGAGDLQLEMGSGPTQGPATVDWQVVTVEGGQARHWRAPVASNSTLVQRATSLPADPGRSQLFLSYKSSTIPERDSAVVALGARHVGSQVHLERRAQGAAMEASVTEFLWPAGFSVASGTLVMEAGAASVVGAASFANAVVMGGYLQHTGITSAMDTRASLTAARVEVEQGSPVFTLRRGSTLGATQVTWWAWSY